MKILFVCLATFADHLWQKLFLMRNKAEGLDNFFKADSCGTSNYNLGDDPDSRTIRSAKKNNIPIHHSARQLTKSDLEEFDLILAMDKNNLRTILGLTNSVNKSKIKLMRSYDPIGEGDVPDPYYGNEKDFDDVFEILNRSVEILVDELVKKTK